MAINEKSYGSSNMIAALTPRFSEDGDFSESTRPTLSTVESLIDQVSALCNGILAAEGFTTPVSQSDAVLIMDSFVESEVAAIVEGINGSGRFGATARKGMIGGGGRWSVVWRDVHDFVSGFASGLEAMGETKVNPSINILTRDTNAAGDEIFPIFQREAFDNHFINWDAGND